MRTKLFFHGFSIVIFLATLFPSVGEVADTIDKNQLGIMLKKGEEFVKGYCDAESVDQFTECREGVNLLEKALQLDPRNTKTLSLLLLGYRNLSPSRGIEIARKLLELNPKDGEAYHFIGTHSESPKERIYALRKAVKFVPNNLWVHGELAWILVYHKMSIPKAVEEIKKQIEVYPGNDVIYGVAEELWKMGYKAEVREIYIAYLKSREQQRRKCRKFVHDALNKFMNHPEVINIFIKECEGYAYYELALMSKSPKEQISLLEKAVELTPTHMLVHGALARVLLEHEGDVDRAIKEMKQQIQRSPIASREEIFFFAQLLGEKKNRDKEVEIYESYLQSNLPKKIKCEMFKSMDLETYKKYQSFLNLLDKMCK